MEEENSPQFNVENFLLSLCPESIEEFTIEADLDLPNQRIIKTDSERTRSKILTSEEKTTLETLLTKYCKEEKTSYKQGMNEIMAPFLILHRQGIPLYMVYTYFKKFINWFLPTMFVDKSFRPLQGFFVLFKLLLRYHEPWISNFFQSNAVSPEFFATSWFLTAFAGKISNFEIIYKLWEEMIVENDRLFSCYIGIAFLIHFKAQIMVNKDNIIQQSISQIMLENTEDYEKIMQIAKKLKNNMPFSIRQKLAAIDIFNLDTIDATLNSLSSQYCLTVLPRDVLEVIFPEKKTCSCLDFQCVCKEETYKTPILLLDCRPKSQQKHGIFPNSALIDTKIYEDEEILNEIPDNYVELRGIYHLFLLGDKEFQGSGFEMDRDTSMSNDQGQIMMENLLGIFISKGFPHVSIIEGGFNECHDLCIKYSLKIENHKKSNCSYCSQKSTRSPSKIREKIKKIKKAVRNKAHFLSTAVKTLKNSFISSSDETNKRRTIAIERNSQKWDEIRHFSCKHYDKPSKSFSEEIFSFLVARDELILFKNSEENRKSEKNIQTRIKITDLIRVTSKTKQKSRVTFFFVKDKQPLRLVISNENTPNECVELIMKYISLIGNDDRCNN